MSFFTYNNTAAPATPAAGKATTFSDTSARLAQMDERGVINQLVNANRQNFLRNSGFWFAQRQNPAALTTYSSATNRLLSADGWGVTCENASAQYIRVDTNGAPEAGLQGRFYGSFTKITSTGKLEITQAIEGIDTEALRGRTVRIQFWMKGIVSASQIVRIGIVNNTGTIDAPTAGFIAAQGANTVDPTLGASLAYIAPKAGVTPDNGVVVGNAVSCTVTSAAWQRFGGVFDVPTSAKNLIVMIWTDSQIAATAGISISQAGLTDGYEVQDWSPLSIQEELARVQRLFCKSFNVDTLPAQAVAIGAVRGHVSVAAAVAAQPIGIRFPVPMRVAPAMVFFNPAAANAFVRNTTAGSDATVTAGANIGDQAADITFTGNAAWTVAQALAIQFTADAEI
jgi:hypothetical protein